MLPSSVLNQLAQIKINADALALVLLEYPQAECPVTHHFGPGIYMRTVSFRPGDTIVGHDHKTPHTVMVLGGRVVMLGENAKEIDATQGPVIFTGGLEKKAAICIEACNWVNIFPNPDDERDIETLESRYLEKSSLALDVEKRELEEKHAYHDCDRADYFKALDDLRITPEEAQRISDRDELVSIPDEYTWRLSIRNSPIHGKGLFLSMNAAEGELIAPATVGGYRTVAGKYVNHSATPNCRYERINGETYLVSIKPISGAFGGNPGDELTADYRQAVNLSMEALQ
jgi:quercetin dioxygenase-like cupin family protein